MSDSANRREFLTGAALFALVCGLPAQATSGVRLDPAETPLPQLALLLHKVCQLVIPRTDTAGAGDVGVGAFLPLAFAHGLAGTREPLRDAPSHWPLRADGSLRYDRWLEQELRARAGENFLRLAPSKQAAILRALDAEAFPAGPPAAVPSPWAKIKGMILIGYYTSEEGASKELQYNLIPGRWDADIPLTPGARAYSSDWTAVEFG